ncbi:MAG: hypothetical protein ACP5C3_05075 [Methanomicrobiales archaeon]
MLRNKNSSIPNLRKKTSIIDLRNINLIACMIILFVVALLAISILSATAAPNSNFPASI